MQWRKYEPKEPVSTYAVLAMVFSPRTQQLLRLAGFSHGPVKAKTTTSHQNNQQQKGEKKTFTSPLNGSNGRAIRFHLAWTCFYISHISFHLIFPRHFQCPCSGWLEVSRETMLVEGLTSVQRGYISRVFSCTVSRGHARGDTLNVC